MKEGQRECIPAVLHILHHAFALRDGVIHPSIAVRPKVRIERIDNCHFSMSRAEHGISTYPRTNPLHCCMSSTVHVDVYEVSRLAAYPSREFVLLTWSMVGKPFECPRHRSSMLECCMSVHKDGDCCCWCTKLRLGSVLVTVHALSNLLSEQNGGHIPSQYLEKCKTYTICFMYTHSSCYSILNT